MFHENLEWRSPHQSSAYADVEGVLGDREHIVLFDSMSNPVHFYGEPDEAMVAWEVGPHVQINTLHPPEATQRDFVAYAYVKRRMTDDIALCSPRSYITNFLLRECSYKSPEEEFPVEVSNRMLRNLKVAQRVNYELQVPETLRQVHAVLNVFSGNVHTMGERSLDEFERLVKIATNMGFATLYALTSGNDIRGASVVYRSENHATLRYYAASHAERAGHKLVYETIKKCFVDGCDIVDMSGVPHPAVSSADSKLRGIYEFKEQFSRDFAEFGPICITQP